MPEEYIDKRKTREKSFHDHRFADDPRKKIGGFYLAFNQTFKTYKSIISSLCPNHHVLEYGCGEGGFSFQMSLQGAIVTGIDISSVAIQHASKSALEKELKNIQFIEMDAEHLDFKDNTFDVVCGVAILHHLNLNQSLSEISRVLKPGGKAIFIEPLKHNPFIQFYRKMTPTLRSVDEAPLGIKDIMAGHKFFETIILQSFNFLTLFLMPFKNYSFYQKLLPAFHVFDNWLFKLLPPIRKYAWQAIITFESPK